MSIPVALDSSYVSDSLLHNPFSSHSESFTSAQSQQKTVAPDA